MEKNSNGGYVSPEISVIEIQMQEIIAASGDQPTVINDPWSGMEEEEW